MANAGLLSYLDLFGDNVISYDGKEFGENIDRKSLIGSRITYSDVTLHSFKISSSTSDEELKTIVEIKMYEDAGLDLEKNYKIAYTRKELDFEENTLIEAFAIDIDKVTKSLSGVLSRTKHIDFLALPFLSFTTLYKNKIIEAKNDIFVYIEEDEAFLSIYKDGKYLSSKSLMNLNEIVKKLEISGVDMSVDELRIHLSEKGLDPSLYERGETTLFNELDVHFSAIFSKINDIVVYNRSVFGFEKIDRIFLSMKSGRICGAREFITSFGFSEVEILDFNLFKDKKDSLFLENIVTSYIYDKFSEEDFRHNLTVFTKEPAFYKKESGKILLAGCAVVVLALGYAGLVYYENMELKKQNDLLEKQYNSMKKTQSILKRKLVDINKELQEITEKKETSKKRIENISVSISEIEELRDIKHNSSSFILEVNELLKKYSLAATNVLLSQNNSISIEIIAEYSKRDNITKFMEDLIDKGFIGITTDEIKSDKDIYLSRIEIKK